MSSSSFVHLQCQSEYSVKNSLIRVPKLIESVQQAGMKSIALTDDMSLFSAVKFYQKAIDSGVKPIFGAKAVTSIKELSKRCLILFLLAFKPLTQ
jgi:DNA polymerase-3 subunit alpha